MILLSSAVPLSQNRGGTRWFYRGLVWQSHSFLALGIGTSLAAVELWVWFGLANQKALIKRPGMNSYWCVPWQRR
jgi:hypothetical protein